MNTNLSSSSNSKVLLIDGFTMKPLQSFDLDALAAIWADPEVTRFLPTRGAPISREGAEKSLASFIDHWEKRGYGIWAIVENFLSEMVGYCGLRYLDELDEVEVLYGLAQAYWGRGIATTAAKASISYGFNVANLNRVIAMTLPDNQASRRVLEKAGLHYQKQVYMFNLNVLYYTSESVEV
jgi:[ribosomal protein S5]-alanine N-acetyltransferase